MRLLLFGLGHDTQIKTKLFWDARLKRRVWYGVVAFFVFLGCATQLKTGLYDCCCLFWDARLSKRLGYETVVVSFEIRDSEEDLAVRLLLFVLVRATQKKNWLSDCCFVLGRATQKKTWLCDHFFSLDARLRRRLNNWPVVVLIFWL